ncbi:MAG TPA: hypothetical protein RMH99_14760 [Sandaracinaceae bacterium LLY-WYZ-13_1]|nr:hypothetical protein [Sandaracinaceae bacterium LLY-WYZ-13_1]
MNVDATSRPVLALVVFAVLLGGPGCGPDGMGTDPSGPGASRLELRVDGRIVDDGDAVPVVIGPQGSRMAVFDVAYVGRAFGSAVDRRLTVATTDGAVLMDLSGTASAPAAATDLHLERVQVIEPPPGPLTVEVEAEGAMLHRTVALRGGSDPPPPSPPTPRLLGLEGPERCLWGAPCQLTLVLEPGSPGGRAAVDVFGGTGPDTVDLPAEAERVSFEIVPEDTRRVDVSVFIGRAPSSQTLSLDVAEAGPARIAPERVAVTPGARVIVALDFGVPWPGGPAEWTASADGVELRASAELGDRMLPVEIRTSAALTEEHTLHLELPDGSMPPVTVAPGVARPAEAGDLAINEIALEGGDWSCDGAWTMDDRFVEVVNVSDHPLDLSEVGVEVIGGGVTDPLAGVVLEAHRALVVFGTDFGGAGEAWCAPSTVDRFGDATALTRDLGLGAHGSAPAVRLVAGDVDLAHARVSSDRPLTRAQDLLMPFGRSDDEAELIPHAEHPDAVGPASPGRAVDGRSRLPLP